MCVKKVFTLIFVHKNDQILLGFKKRGFGQNKWNGFGGKLEPGETIKDAAVRELKEESCLSVKKKDLKNIGQLEFTFEGDSVVMDVRVFSSTIYEGIPTETEEMMPKWFSCDTIPFDNMWPDDRYWFPYMLHNEMFYGRFHYQGYEKIVYYTIRELNSLEDFYTNRN